VDQGQFELYRPKWRPILCRLGLNFDGAARLFTVPGLSWAYFTYRTRLVCSVSAIKLGIHFYLLQFVFRIVDLITSQLFHEQRNWVLATNLNFLISLQPSVVDSRHFKLWILLDQITLFTYEKSPNICVYPWSWWTRFNLLLFRSVLHKVSKGNIFTWNTEDLESSNFQTWMFL